VTMLRRTVLALLAMLLLAAGATVATQSVSTTQAGQSWYGIVEDVVKEVPRDI
jgi:hypothetical protein